MNIMEVIATLALLFILIGELIFVCQSSYEDRFCSDVGEFVVEGCIILSLLGLITALIFMIIHFI